jgi:cytochrome c2
MPGATDPTRRSQWRRRLIGAGALALLSLICGAVGYAVRDSDLVARVIAKIDRVLDRSPSDVAEAEHSEIDTTFHRLSMSRYRVGQAWMLEEIDGRIVFSSRHGHFGYVQGDRLRSLDLVAPLGLDALDASVDTINPDHVRVTDLLALPAGADRFELFAAHLIYTPACIRLAISAATITTTHEALRADPRWRRVFSGACLPPRASGLRHIGNQSGGRLAALDAATLALSTGDFEFVGAEGEPRVSDDPNSELGKLLAVSLADGRVRILASGLRNPQGLLRSRTGALWETEHGPRGGDEVNLVLPGRDYGWPNVSYGAPYGDVFSPSWPPHARAGVHDGYERPRYVFLPSIGISNLIEPDVEEFPDWRSSLIVSSLAGSALYVLRIDGGTVLSSERIALPDMRVRDIIALADGRFALATDAGDLVIVANAERAHEPLDALAGLHNLNDAPALSPWSAIALHNGERLFASYCSGCHSLDGAPGPGPSLAQIVGAQVGSAPGFSYSPALSGRRERWSEARIVRFLRDVDGAYPGTTMPQPDADLDFESIANFLAMRQRAHSSDARRAAP